MNSIEFTIVVAESEREILIAELADLGCDGFEELEHSLKAYTSESSDKVEQILSRISAHGLSCQQQVIPEQNWNALWEASFDPVIVPGFCTIRAPFHQPAQTPFEVIILPKMSFGTGHHATTRLMMQSMKDIHFGKKSVLDFGTGTGILAILAKKLGAGNTMAIDIDEWSVRNAEENAATNSEGAIAIQRADISELDPELQFDILLANINRNVLLESMQTMHSRILPSGLLLLSGFLKPDAPKIIETAVANGFTLMEATNEAEWMCLKFTA
ncbi:MAG: 50S ribosomal protein L11 methyltransferase [Bacteroidetes bacterium]|nr:50S ribosomal protein L11 methyltransferase [Bacteroidota bacterium]MBS1629623.1 50S ribosomal protein L11 methyltransferase [Bacteroidota bacterium]